MHTKEGDIYDGILRDIDMYMNLHLIDVTVTTSTHSLKRNAESLFIRGTSVRSIKPQKVLLEKHQQLLDRISKRYRFHVCV